MVLPVAFEYLADFLPDGAQCVLVTCSQLLSPKVWTSNQDLGYGGWGTGFLHLQELTPQPGRVCGFCGRWLNTHFPVSIPGS